MTEFRRWGPVDRPQQSNSISIIPTNLEDYEAITRVLEHYVDGAKSGKGSEMARAFHREATVFGFAGTELDAGPVAILFAWTDKNGPAAGIKSQIAAIDVVGTIATVRLEIDNWSGSRASPICSRFSS
jgi:hypothetical protein